MKPFANLLAAASMLLLLTGCAAYKHNRAGDAAAQTGDMRGAVYHYERALASKDKYGQDTEFMTKLSVARSRVAYDDAQIARREGRYEQALDHLRESMRQDPAYAEPSELMLVVLKEAARWRYTKAVAAADAGDLMAARDHLSRAMQHDLTDESVSYAMASLTPETLPADTPGLSEYRGGLDQASERRWLAAEQTQRAAIATNAGLLPARAALHEARVQLAEARRLQQDGQTFIDQLKMGPAITSLTESLETWPFNTRATELVTHAKAQRARADEQFVKATNTAAKSQWDEAIALADSGLAIDRSHPALGKLRGDLPRRAAADHTRRGDSHLEQGDLDKAHASYTRAMSYRSTYREARLGMSYIYAAWAEQREEAGQYGAALLNYAKGQSYLQSTALDEGVIRTRIAVRDRLGLGLSVSAEDSGRGAIDPRELSAALLGTLESKQHSGLALQGKDTPYELRLSITNNMIQEQLTNSSRRTHRYTTTEYRYNPEYDRAEARVNRERRLLHHLQSQRASAKCIGHDDGSACRCFASLDQRIASQGRALSHAKSHFKRTPRKIKYTLYHDWHYTVETITKTGELRVITELIDTTSGKPVKSFTHQASFAQSDDRTLNANPSVGVRQDDLRLHSDDYVGSALTSELASSAGPWALNAMINHRLDQINAAIAALGRQGKPAEALEARIDAAVALGIVDPKASQQALDKLTASHTR